LRFTSAFKLRNRFLRCVSFPRDTHTNTCRRLLLQKITTCRFGFTSAQNLRIRFLNFSQFFAYMYTCTYMYISICVYIYTYMYIIYMCVYICIYVCVYICIYIYVNINIYKHIFSWHTHTLSLSLSHTHTHTHTQEVTFVGIIFVQMEINYWGVATISRLLKIIGLFCKRAL